MSSVSKFFWFMQERERIHHRRLAGLSPPWTRDTVLQNHHFCNVFREDDRVSQYWASAFQRTPNKRLQIVNTALFRLFNLPSTWTYLKPNWNIWVPKMLLKKLNDNSSCPSPIFNSAYMVTGSTGKGQPKHVSAIEACDHMYQNFQPVARALEARTLEAVTEAIALYPMMGRFMGYEVACDLEMCGLLNNPFDRDTWANMGPGAKRGLNRIYKRPLKDNISQEHGVQDMRKLFEKGLQKQERGSLILGKRLTMRAIEHTLCEFDKYERATKDPNARLRRFNPRT